MNKKILLLDTSFSAKPIYDFLFKTGADVYVIGGKPEDALAKSARNYINLDYSNINQVLNLIEQEQFDFIVPGGNDLSYKVCSQINDNSGKYFNIDPIEVNEIINNKDQFRKYALRLGIHVPRIIRQEEIKNNLPVIIKPADAYSGHGMTVIREAKDDHINKAIEHSLNFSRLKDYVIEEFIEGQLYSHSAFWINGKIEFDFIVEEHCVVNQYAVDTSRVIHGFDKKTLELIRKDITTLADSLNLSDGLIHSQLIIKGNNFYLIEITRRCPGDLYSKLIELSTGFPYAEFYTRPFINISDQYTDFQNSEKPIIRHTLTIDTQVIYNSLCFHQSIGSTEFMPLSLTGDVLKESPFGRIGILFAESKNEEEELDLLKEFLNRTVYSIS